MTRQMALRLQVWAKPVEITSKRPLSILRDAGQPSALAAAAADNYVDSPAMIPLACADA